MRSEFIWILFGRIAAALIAIASLRIMTTLLDPKDFGLYALLVAFQGFSGLLLINPVGQHINRNTHAWWDDGTLFKRLTSYNHYLIIVTLCMFFAVLAWWLLYPSTDRKFLSAIFAALSVAVLVYLGTWNGTFVYILNMLGFRRSSVVCMLASSIIGLSFSTFFAAKYHSGVFWILGQALGMAMGMIGAGLILRQRNNARKLDIKNLNEETNLLDRKSIQFYILPLAAATGFMWLQSSGYRFWVGATWGAVELGFLAVGLGISLQIWASMEALAMQFLNPFFFRHMTLAHTEIQRSSILSDMINLMLPLYAVLAGFNLVFAKPLLSVLANERYQEALIFVFFGAVIEFMRCSANLWSYAAQIERRTMKYVGPYGYGALIVWLGAIGFSYIGLKIWSMAATLVVSYFVMCAFMIRAMQSILPVKLDIFRFSIGGGFLVACFFLATFIPLEAKGLMPNLALIVAGLFVVASAIFALIWKNPALSRLLAVNLRAD